MSDAVVLLAAGAGRRFLEGAAPAGTTRSAPHKLLAPLGRSTVVRTSVEVAIAADVGPVIVVWGAVDLVEALAGCNAQLVEHAGWAKGQATSLQAGIDAVDAAGHARVIVGLADPPTVGVDAWRAVASAAEGPVVVARYDGVVTPPVRLDRQVWPLLPKDGDEGARRLFGQLPGMVHYVDIAGDPADIDTVEDLQRWS